MPFSAETVLWLVLLIPSIVLHEISHGYAAYRLGDPTAKNAGRLSLNPLKHIDPFGTVILPLLLFAAGAPIFGYAKPVPYNPRYFKNIQRGDLIVGLAGPTANLVLALLGAAVFRAAGFVPAAAGGWVQLVGATLALTNLVLMFFNLIPIPPLDGSSIITLFMPTRWLPGWYRAQRYSFVVLLALLWVVPRLLNVDPIGAYFRVTVRPLLQLFLGVPTG
jgi:Zn-dependent protease